MAEAPCMNTLVSWCWAWCGLGVGHEGDCEVGGTSGRVFGGPTQRAEVQWGVRDGDKIRRVYGPTETGPSVPEGSILVKRTVTFGDWEEADG